LNCRLSFIFGGESAGELVSPNARDYAGSKIKRQKAKGKNQKFQRRKPLLYSPLPLIFAF
jgi:hypothetical protein